MYAVSALPASSGAPARFPEKYYLTGLGAAGYGLKQFGSQHPDWLIP
jgi:hypothetical protein